jgi:hypothetical protein
MQPHMNMTTEMFLHPSHSQNATCDMPPSRPSYFFFIVASSSMLSTPRSSTQTSMPVSPFSPETVTTHNGLSPQLHANLSLSLQISTAVPSMRTTMNNI